VNEALVSKRLAQAAEFRLDFEERVHDVRVEVGPTLGADD
jgi:hypothetical protein